MGGRGKRERSSTCPGGPRDASGARRPSGLLCPGHPRSPTFTHNLLGAMRNRPRPRPSRRHSRCGSGRRRIGEAGRAARYAAARVRHRKASRAAVLRRDPTLAPEGRHRHGPPVPARTTKDVDLSIQLAPDAVGPTVPELRDLLPAAADRDAGNHLIDPIGEPKRALTNAPRGARYPCEAVLVGKVRAIPSRRRDRRRVVRLAGRADRRQPARFRRHPAGAGARDPEAPAVRRDDARLHVPLVGAAQHTNQRSGGSRRPDRAWPARSRAGSFRSQGDLRDARHSRGPRRSRRPPHHGRRTFPRWPTRQRSRRPHYREAFAIVERYCASVGAELPDTGHT